MRAAQDASGKLYLLQTRTGKRTGPAAVRSSWACVGLTVVTTSAKARPPLSRFSRPCSPHPLPP